MFVGATKPGIISSERYRTGPKQLGTESGKSQMNPSRGGGGCREKAVREESFCIPGDESVLPFARQRQHELAVTEGGPSLSTVLHQPQQRRESSPIKVRV